MLVTRHPYYVGRRIGGSGVSAIYLPVTKGQHLLNLQFNLSAYCPSQRWLRQINGAVHLPVHAFPQSSNWNLLLELLYDILLDSLNTFTSTTGLALLSSPCRSRRESSFIPLEYRLHSPRGSL
ncbi:uncharacterized protein TrAtP1_003730 [Trichoderma atroviride]|uniref:uncharacterized protein n=1 Tax=Hypocrea atroviridis TaxID=63577 RepID=UPI003332A423|nr:hypothetical protein TrAtP1_003730 [Trichoderma atroviride]